MDTGAKYRDSLRASPSELERQRLREIDLVKILARLYASYVESLVAHGCLTPTDAVYEATLLLRAQPERRAAARARYAAALVDDAQDLTTGQLALLAEIFGPALGGVTLAGDADQATRGFATGARGGDVFKKVTQTIVLDARHRCDPDIERIARRALDPTGPPLTLASRDDETVALYRADSMRDEARYVTAEIEALVRAGTPPERIAIVSRTLGCAQTFVNALLARNVPVDLAGAASLYEFPAVLDALAALWSSRRPVPARLSVALARGTVDASLRRIDRDVVCRGDRSATIAFRTSGRRTRNGRPPLGPAPRSPARTQRDARRRRCRSSHRCTRTTRQRFAAHARAGKASDARSTSRITRGRSSRRASSRRSRPARADVSTRRSSHGCSTRSTRSRSATRSRRSTIF